MISIAVSADVRMIQGSFFNSMKLLAKMATPKTVRNRAGQTRSGFDIDGLGEEGPPPEIMVLSYKMTTPIRINADPATRQPITTVALPRLALNISSLRTPSDNHVPKVNKENNAP